jgi:hypothetical protein
VTALPLTVKCEAKVTTGKGVQVAARELEALAGDERTAGVLACLFWCGDRRLDGHWLLVDAARLRAPYGGTLSMTKDALADAAGASASLEALRRHVDDRWTGFLDAFRDEALAGHAALVAALARGHADGTTAARLPVHRVLEVEHRATIAALLEAHGESGVGRLLQDLLAYVVAFAGYRQVTNNPVGVPDFVVSDLDAAAGGGRVVVELSAVEAERILSLCRSAGDEQLATALARRVRALP